MNHSSKSSNLKKGYENPRIFSQVRQKWGQAGDSPVCWCLKWRQFCLDFTCGVCADWGQLRSDSSVGHQVTLRESPSEGRHRFLGFLILSVGVPEGLLCRPRWPGQAAWLLGSWVIHGRHPPPPTNHAALSQDHRWMPFRGRETLSPVPPGLVAHQLYLVSPGP